MLIGAGAQFEWIESSVANEHDPNVTVLPLLPFEMVPWSLASGDIALVCMERGIEGISMPSKTYASLAAGSDLAGMAFAAGSTLGATASRATVGSEWGKEGFTRLSSFRSSVSSVSSSGG